MKIPFYNCDVYVNVVGGLNLDGTSGDLGLAIALLSRVKSKAIELDKTIVVGEIGLTGEVRAISHCEKTVKEVSILGLKT